MIIKEYTLRPEQSAFLYRISFLSLFSSLYAVYRGHYDLSLGPGGVFLTSINYWRNPVSTSWRRYIDMIYVKLAVIYQIYRAYNAEYWLPFYLVLAIGLSCYPIGNYYYSKKRHWHSIYAHSMIHVIANISNIILYSGYVPSF